MRNARKEVANLYKSLMVDANQLLTALKRLFLTQKWHKRPQSNNDTLSSNLLISKKIWYLYLCLVECAIDFHDSFKTCYCVSTDEEFWYLCYRQKQILLCQTPQKRTKKSSCGQVKQFFLAAVLSLPSMWELRIQDLAQYNLINFGKSMCKIPQLMFVE